MKTLHVFWDSVLVGGLNDLGARRMSFTYAGDFLESPRPRPISWSLPLQIEAATGPEVAAWFANLLPEGSVRSHVAQRLGVSERNEFALLAALGGECAGALRLLPRPELPQEREELIPLPWPHLESLLNQGPRPSLLALVMQGREPRLSLAGAQDKLPVQFRAGLLSLPQGAAISTHLLKVSTGDFPDLIQNELFCLTLARQVGLPVPAAEIVAQPTPVLLVERYDRRDEGQGTVRRLHQEDFCQVLGQPPETKYENEGGPPLTAIFAVLAAAGTSPLADKRELLRWVLFNFLIGNADAHAKNVSLLYGALDDPHLARLAPFYDLVCTAAYPGLSPRHAHRIGGEYRPGRIQRRHWDRQAEAIGVKPGYLGAIGLDLCGDVASRAGRLAATIGQAHGGEATLAKVVRVIEKRAVELGRELGGG